MKKFLALALALIMVLSLVACGGSKKEEPKQEETQTEETTTPETPAEPEYVFRCSTNHAESFNVSEALRYWSDLVLERTNGRIKIEIYYDAVLGDEKSAIEQTQYGGLEFARVNISPMSEFVDDLNALGMPYLYDNDEHFWEALETIGMDMMTSQEMIDAGFYGLTWYDGGTRNFYYDADPVHTPADMVGLNLRVQESNLMMSMVEALGASAITLPFADVYAGIQTGVCDGAENSVVQYLEMSHYEVAPCITLDGHTRSPDMLVMSQKTREMLSDEDVQIIADAAIESWELQRGLWADVDAEARAELESRGATFVDLTPEEVQTFVDACAPMWEEYEGGKYMDVINEVRALVG